MCGPAGATYRVDPASRPKSGSTPLRADDELMDGVILLTLTVNFSNFLFWLHQENSPRVKLTRRFIRAAAVKRSLEQPAVFGRLEIIKLVFRFPAIGWRPKDRLHSLREPQQNKAVEDGWMAGCVKGLFVLENLLQIWVGEVDTCSCFSGSGNSESFFC